MRESKSPRLFTALLSVLSVSLAPSNVHGCTNILVTKGASVDGSPMIAYNADSGDLFGYLYHYPAITQSEHDTLNDPQMRSIYDWDSGKYLGEIPEALQTYNVVGNTNSMGLTIAETTFGGIEALSHQPGAIMDYGSLIYVALQRASTAREAIDVMTALMDEYGYASEGESFSLSDSTTGEVWMMEVIGRGSKSEKKGAVWVALKIPDGAVAAHANQARITTFPRDDPENCLYAEDVIDFAIEMGLYKRMEGDVEDALFSFSDVYDPLTFTGVRLGEARVWSIFSNIMGDDFQQLYKDYASGHDLLYRMPLFVFPNEKISLEDVDRYMSSHYEGTSLAMDHDVGAGEFSAPYRTRPLVWTYNNKKYTNERSIATQQTGWNFIAQMRPHSNSIAESLSEDFPHTHHHKQESKLPQYISSVLWFGVDDSSLSPRVPVYGCATSVSEAYAGKGPQDGVTSPLGTFDITKAFWVQNMVSNFAYSRWYMTYPIIKEKREFMLQSYQKQVEEMDKKIMENFGSKDVVGGTQTATTFTVQKGDDCHREWWEFYGDLFVRFRDFFDITEKKSGVDVHIKEVGFTDEWKKKIVAEDGEKYEVPMDTTGNDHSNVGVDDDDRDGNGDTDGEDWNGFVMLRGAMFELAGDESVPTADKKSMSLRKLDIIGM